MLEGRGIPSVVLGTDAFMSLARAASLKYGLPHLAVATVPHPIGGIAPNLVAAKAEMIVAEGLAALTRDPAPPAAVSASAGAGRGAGPADLRQFQTWARAR